MTGFISCLLKFYSFLDRLPRHQKSMKKAQMSSRRATNNSSVASLEEQNNIISQVLSIADPVRITGTSVDPAKVPKKKKAKDKMKGSKGPSAGGPGVPSTSAPGSSVGPGSDVTSGVRPAPGRDVTDPPEEVEIEVNGHGDGTQSLGNDASDVSGNGNLFAEAMQAQSNEQLLAFQQQQQWWWQQMCQGFGNYIPNMAFGEAPQVFWDQEDESSEVADVAEAMKKAKEGAGRQPDHVISDDEEEEPVPIPVPIPVSTSAATQPSVAGIEPVISVEEILEGHRSQVKEADRVSEPTTESVAEVLNAFLADAQSGAELEKMAKKYPRVENVQRMKLQRLDNEVFSVVDQNLRNADQAVQSIQKGVLGCMSALTPLLGLALDRGKADKELNKLGANVVDTLHMLAFVNNTLSSRRREFLRPHLAPTYAKVMTKGHNPDSDWLYGGDLLETTKQCEAAKKIGEKVLKKRQSFAGFPGRGRGNPNKRFRFQGAQGFPPFPQQQQGLRAMALFQFQQPRFQVPQGIQQLYPLPVPQHFVAGYHRRGRYPRPQQQRQGFARRGAPRQ